MHGYRPSYGLRGRSHRLTHEGQSQGESSGTIWYILKTFIYRGEMQFAVNYLIEKICGNLAEEPRTIHSARCNELM